MRYALLLLAAAAFLGAAPAAAPAATLKSQSIVSGDTVRLGDLFDDVGDKAGTVIGRAPAPGGRAVYDAPFLMRVAAAFGVPWRPANDFDRVLIERASAVITADEIRGRLAEALQQRLGTRRLDVTLDNRAFVINVPIDQPAGIEVQNISYDATLGRFAAVLVAAPGGPDPVRVPVSGRVQEVIAVPVLKRQVMPGEVISASDVDWTDLRIDANAADVLRDEAGLVGHTPRRGLPPGATIRARDVQAPILVAKGALVRIVLETPMMVLTAQGRALDNGARGETIRVINTQSNRPIEAVVAGPNLVNVVTATHVALTAETPVQ